jgi:hypothetical protein
MNALVALLALLPSQGGPVKTYSRTGAQIVEVDLTQVRVKVAIAKDLVGRTEELSALAKRHNALAAINGSFFEAYLTGAIKSPNQTLMSEGRFLHVGTTGSVLAFSSTNEVRLSSPRFTIEGAREGSYTWPNRWFAYWLNRLPSADTVTLFTPDWGPTTGISDGTQVVVKGSVVEHIGPGPQSIPTNGYVILFRGAEDRLLQSFKVGQRAEYRIVEKATGRSFWPDVREAVGGGPTLVKGGQIALNLQAEGFRDPKILSGAGARSLVGVTGGKKLLLVTTAGTIPDVAKLMQSLGCTEAMNLDGGASSGLWFRGKYLRKPGRLISNALLILPR